MNTGFWKLDSGLAAPLSARVRLSDGASKIATIKCAISYDHPHPPSRTLSRSAGRGKCRGFCRERGAALVVKFTGCRDEAQRRNWFCLDRNAPAIVIEPLVISMENITYPADPADYRQGHTRGSAAHWSSLRCPVSIPVAHRSGRCWRA